MSNTITTSTIVLNTALRGLLTNCQVVKALNTSYSSKFSSFHGDARKGGATIYVPKPALGTVRTSWNINVADETQLTVPITIDTVRGIDMSITEAERVYTIDEAAEYSRDFVMPKVSQLCATIDAYCASYMKNRIWQVSPTTIGTAPNAITYYTAATRLMKESLVPNDGPLSCIISPRSEQAMVVGLAGQYNPNGNISEMYEKGQMAKAGGMDWYTSQNMPSHTHGTCTTGTSPAVSGYGVNTLTISGVTSGGTLKAGDSFYLDTTCLSVNYETKGSYAQGQRFVATTDATASGTNITVTVKPDIYISGPNQTVDSTPVGAAVTFHQTTASQVCQNDFILHKDAFALSFADLYVPKGMEVAKKMTKNGVTVRYVKGWDINTSQQISRLDVFFGISDLRPEWAGRVIS
jgi:hypothetical protein